MHNQTTPNLSPNDDPQGPGPLSRRSALSAVGAFGLAAVLAACANASKAASITSPITAAGSTGGSTAATDVASGAVATCATIPEETAGPYPGDGSNGKNILNQSGVVRTDITSSIGSGTGMAEGVPLTIQFTVVDTANGCAAMPGAGIYVWHANREGQYSMYSQDVVNENYLRGVAETDSSGTVSFTSVFPAAYDGRWPHIHFEVYPDVATALTGTGKLATSQIALPKATCDTVYATTGYEQSVINLAKTSLQSDMVFRDDGAVHQLATMTGSVDSGLTAALTVPV